MCFRPLPRTESLAMPEAVPASGRVRNFKVCGHINMVSQVPNVLSASLNKTFLSLAPSRSVRLCCSRHKLLPVFVICSRITILHGQETVFKYLPSPTMDNAWSVIQGDNFLSSAALRLQQQNGPQHPRRDDTPHSTCKAYRTRLIKPRSNNL